MPVRCAFTRRRAQVGGSPTRVNGHTGDRCHQDHQHGAGCQVGHPESVAVGSAGQVRDVGPSCGRHARGYTVCGPPDDAAGQIQIRSRVAFCRTTSLSDDDSHWHESDQESGCEKHEASRRGSTRRLPCGHAGGSAPGDDQSRCQWRCYVREIVGDNRDRTQQQHRERFAPGDRPVGHGRVSGNCQRDSHDEYGGADNCERIDDDRPVGVAGHESHRQYKGIEHEDRVVGGCPSSRAQYRAHDLRGHQGQEPDHGNPDHSVSNVGRSAGRFCGFEDEAVRDSFKKAAKRPEVAPAQVLVDAVSGVARG